jgi:chromosome segregation ATPase
MKTQSQIEIEKLKTNNSRLNSIIQELRWEVTYYQSEARRLEWEKNALMQDIERMTTMCKSWVENNLTAAKSKSLMNDANYFNTLVRYPCKASQRSIKGKQ